MSVSLPVVPLRSPGVPSALLGRRLARVAFGAVLALAPVAIWAGFLARGDSSMRTAPLFAVVWVSALVVGAAAGRFGRSITALSLFDAEAFDVASYVLPAVGIAVAGPLSLHACLGLPLWLLGALTDDVKLMGAFDYWVGVSLLGTVHVHVAFAVAMGMAAKAVAVGDPAARVRVWPAVLLSIFPGILLVFPPFLVLGTGALLAEAFLACARAWRRDDLQASLC